jgi:hypothetical protein
VDDDDDEDELLADGEHAATTMVTASRPVAATVNLVCNADMLNSTERFAARESAFCQF